MTEFKTMWVKGLAAKVFPITITLHPSLPIRTLCLIFQWEFLKVIFYTDQKLNFCSSLLRINENIIMEQCQKVISWGANGEYKAISSNMRFLDFGCLLFGLFVDTMTGNSITPIRRRLFKQIMGQSGDEYYKEPGVLHVLKWKDSTIYYFGKKKKKKVQSGEG